MSFEKAISFLLIGSFLIHASARAHETNQLDTPELVAMAWGIEDETSQLEDVQFFDAQGEPINSVSLIGELTTTFELDHFKPKLNREDLPRLRPLILIFRRIENSTISKVGPIFNKESVQPIRGWTTEPVGESDLFVTPVIPIAATHPTWDESAELSIRFAPVKPEQKNLTEEFTERQEVVKGLWVGLSQVHRESRISFEFKLNRGEFPEADFNFWIEHENGVTERPNLAVTRRLGEIDLVCLSTKPVQPNKVKSISVSRTAFVYQSIGKIRIPKESLDDK